MQVIDKIRDDLAYRLPGGGKLAVVILSREQAENLVAEWDELATPEGPSMSERIVLWIVSAALALAIIIILTISYGRTAELMECSSRKSGDGYWSWREVDGRRCWYPGRPGKSKTELHWSRMPTPQDAKPVAVERPGAIVPAPGPLSTGEEVVQDGGRRTSHNNLPASSEARALTPEEEQLLTTYWPDLAELEKSVGLKPRELPPLPPFEPLRITAPKQKSSSWSWLWVFLVPAGYISFVLARSKWRERKVVRHVDLFADRKTIQADGGLV